MDFLMDPGHQPMPSADREEEYRQMIKYFLASLAIPEQDLWVNLSPFEKDRIIADNFGRTEMGRDLLVQDYVLKEITSSLLHPDGVTGKAFWKKVYQEAYDRYGTADVPVDVFNKVWIVPDTAVVVRKGTSVVLSAFHLKVMLEDDYWASAKVSQLNSVTPSAVSAHNDIAKRVMLEIVIPVIEKEVNEGESFAPLRQMTAALVLATWYKSAWKKQLLNALYSDRARLRGVDQDPANNQQVFERYVAAFQQGAFNVIHDDQDAVTAEVTPRKYFSGGYSLYMSDKDGAMISLSARITEAGGLPAEWAQKVLDLVSAKFSVMKRGEGTARSRTSRLGVGAFVLGLYLAMNVSAWGISPESADLIGRDALTAGRTNVLTKIQQSGAYDAMLKNYFKKKGHLSSEEFPKLSLLLKETDLERLSMDSFTGAVRSWMVKMQAANDTGGMTLLGNELTRLTQLLVREWAVYNPESKSIIDILQRMGWKCDEISRNTVILAAEGGVDNVSVVDVLKDANGKTYPDSHGIGHATVLKINTDGSAWIYEQGQIPTQQGYIVRVLDPKVGWQTIGIEELNARHLKWQGLTLPRLAEYLKAQSAFDSIFSGMARWGEVKRRANGEMDARVVVNSVNAVSIVEAFPGIQQQLLKAVPGSALNESLAKNVSNLQQLLSEQLAEARKIQRGDREMKNLLLSMKDWCSYTEVGGSFRVRLSITAENSAAFLKLAEGYIARLHGMAVDPGIAPNIQELAAQLEADLKGFRTTGQSASEGEDAVERVIAPALRSSRNTAGWYTVEQGAYRFSIATKEQSVLFMRQAPGMIQRLGELAEDVRISSPSRSNARVLKEKISGMFDEMKRAQEKDQGVNQILDRYNGLIKEYNGFVGRHPGREEIQQFVAHAKAFLSLELDVLSDVEMGASGGARTVQTFEDKKENPARIRASVEKLVKTVQAVNQAMTSDPASSAAPIGGIDLNPQRFVLTVQGGEDLAIPPQDVRQEIFSMQGISPGILSIRRTADFFKGWEVTQIP